MASKKIKGITIEISGDTSKLDKSLAQVDKEAKSTQKTLREVNNLLKLDPKNTELLAQKQHLLGQQLDQTTQKAEALRNAIESHSGSNVNYAKWIDAQSAIQGQITKTENSLKALEAEQERYNQLGFDPKSEAMQELQGKIDSTKTKAESLRQKMQDTYNELGRPVPVEELEKWKRELIGAEQAAREAEKAVKDFNSTASNMSAAADKVSEGAGKISNATKGISIAAGAGVAGLVGLAAKAGSTADDLNTLSKQSGFDTQTLQEWTYAADLVDVSVDSIISAAAKMKKNMVSNSADTQAAFAQLGVSVLDNSGQLRDATDVFYSLLFALSRVENETERDVLAMQIFGKGADELAGIIDDGGEALRALGQEAQDAGLILSQDALDGANEFNDGLDRIKAKANAAFMESGAALAENLLPVLDKAVDALGALLQWLGSLDGGQLQMLIGVLVAIAGISPVAGAISNISKGLSGVFDLVGKISGRLSGMEDAAGAAGKAAAGLGGKLGSALDSAYALFTGPVGIAVGATAAAGALIYLWETNEDFRNALMEFDEWITGIFTTDWTESFGAAGEVLNGFFAGVQDIYEAIKRILGGIIDFVAGAFTGDWERAWQGVQDIFGGIFDGLVAIVKTPFNLILGAVNSLLQFLTDGLNAAIDALNTISFDVPDWVPFIGGRTFGFDIPNVTAPQIPYLANGGLLTQPTLFMGGEYAGAQQNPEIVAPYSMMVEANEEALRNIGYSGNTSLTILIKAAPGFTRYLSYELDAESVRRGVNLVKA